MALWKKESESGRSVPVHVERSMTPSRTMGYPALTEDWFGRFPSVFRGFDLPSFFRGLEPFGTTGMTVPVDVKETRDEVEVTAELPGMTEKEIEVSLGDGMLTIRGEKHSEREETGRGIYFSERSYGSFQRSIELPADVDPEKVDAKFKNGVLEVHLKKAAPSEPGGRRIEVKAG